MGNPETLTILWNVLRQFSPSLVFLFETRLVNAWATGVRFSIGYSNAFVVDYVGWSGGILLVWKEDLDVTIRSYSRGHVDALIISHRGYKLALYWVRWQASCFK